MREAREQTRPDEAITHRFDINMPVSVCEHNEQSLCHEWQLSDHEYSLIVAHNAFNRWITRCMAAVGYPDFSPLDILVLHSVNHRKRAKRLADICFVLNVEDQHTVNYSLKKMLKSGLVEGERRGKERFYRTTTQGETVCRSYLAIRTKCLRDAAERQDDSGDGFHHLATALRDLSGFYDQVARAASSV